MQSMTLYGSGWLLGILVIHCHTVSPVHMSVWIWMSLPFDGKPAVIDTGQFIRCLVAFGLFPVKCIFANFEMTSSLGYSIWNPYTPCGRFWKSVPQRGCEFSNAPTSVWLYCIQKCQMRVSTWNSHSPCGRCFLNLPQGVCGIQMELPIKWYQSLVNLYCLIENLVSNCG